MQRISDRYDSFIFDWDGTIVSLTPIRKADARFDFKISFKKNKERKNKDFRVKNEDIESNLYKVYRKSIGRIKDAEHNFKNRIEIFVLDIILRFVKPRLHNGVLEVLKELDKKNKEIAVFSDGNLNRLLKEVEILKIENYFTAILSAQSVGKLKPNPLGIEILIKSMNCKKERTLYIGDMVDDVDAARNAGISSCAIAGGFNTYEDLKNSNPDYLFGSMEEFEKNL